MHLSKLMFLIYGVFCVFQTRGFIFRKTAVHTGMVQYVLRHQYKQSCR